MLTAGPQLLSDLHFTYVSRRCGKEEEEEAEEEEQQQEQQKIHHCACRLISDFFFHKSRRDRLKKCANIYLLVLYFSESFADLRNHGSLCWD